jgi:hypothetical protein
MNRVKVLETNILHASDVIFWLDGSSSEDPATMLRLPAALELELTTQPSDLRVVNSAGKTAFLRRPTNPIIFGSASEADMQPPVTPTFPIAGIVSDVSGRYLSRRFAIAAGNRTGHGLVIYPSPLGSRFGPAGGLLGTLRFNTSGAPAPWALLTLTVTTTLGASLTFRGQANGQGDFILPLNRLPPLPEGITDYAATLAISALESAVSDSPIDPADLVAMQLGELAVDAVFSDPISLTLVPGEIRLIRSSSQNHLAVQPN